MRTDDTAAGGREAGEGETMTSDVLGRSADEVLADTRRVAADRRVRYLRPRQPCGSHDWYLYPYGDGYSQMTGRAITPLLDDLPLLPDTDEVAAELRRLNRAGLVAEPMVR